MDLFWHLPEMLNLIAIWAIRRQGQSLKLLVTFLWPFLEVCQVALSHCRGHNHWSEGLNLVCSGVWMGVCQSGIHMNARIQGFTAERLAVH